MKFLYSPWTDEQVLLLRERQQVGILHEYTCGFCSTVLTPTNHGWYCSSCQDYVQDWCFEADATELWWEATQEKFERVWFGTQNKEE